MRGTKLSSISDTGSLITIFLALLVFGNIMVFSASSVSAYEEFGDSFFYLKKNMAWMSIGAAALILFSKYNYRNLRSKSVLFLAASIILLIAVLIIGIEINGARRWLDFGYFNFQPSEFTKLSVIIYGSAILSQKHSNYTKYVLLRLLPIVSVAAIMILKQPDLGTTLVIGAIAMFLLFISGIKFRHLFLIFSAGLIGSIVAIFSAGYRVQRLKVFLDPWGDPQNTGFQVVQALTAFGSGGLFGRGIGRSMQKFSYLPQAHTDFIFAIIGEEAGLIGTLGVILLFCLFGYFGFRVAYRTPDRFGKLLAGTLTAAILLQAGINIGATTSFLPVTGIPLPLISYGGTSLVITMISVGILINISNARKIGVVNESHDMWGRDRGSHISRNSSRRHHFRTSS